MQSKRFSYIAKNKYLAQRARVEQKAAELATLISERQPYPAFVHCVLNAVLLPFSARVRDARCQLAELKAQYRKTQNILQLMLSPELVLAGA